jgi:hypothetical protein
MIGDYTHPSMPRTGPIMLSAALEDAEGTALVEKILVERVTYCMAQGLHGMGGKCGSCGVTP